MILLDSAPAIFVLWNGPNADLLAKINRLLSKAVS